MVPIAPTAQPFRSSTNEIADSGSSCPVGCISHELPASEECKMYVPGEPAIQTCGPMALAAWKSNSCIAAVGMGRGGSCQLRPPSSLRITSPPSPASQPAASPSSFRSWMDRRPRLGVRDLIVPRVVTTLSEPFLPASAPLVMSRKSLHRHSADRPPPAMGDQLRPPSLVWKTPLGKVAEGSPTAQPREVEKNFTCRSIGSVSLGIGVHVRPPSSVRSSTASL